MKLPCGHDTPQGGCVYCLLCEADPHHRAAWGGEPAPPRMPPPPAAPVTRSLPCVYLGEVTDRLNCNCPGRWLRKCSLLRRGVSVNGDCKKCEHYEGA